MLGIGLFVQMYCVSIVLISLMGMQVTWGNDSASDKKQSAVVQ